jgi:hypothetical protein
MKIISDLYIVLFLFVVKYISILSIKKGSLKVKIKQNQMIITRKEKKTYF